MALGGRTEIQDGGFQHVVMLEPAQGDWTAVNWFSIRRMVSAMLGQWHAVQKINFGFPWSMSPDIASSVDFCRGGSGPGRVNYLMTLFYF